MKIKAVLFDLDGTLLPMDQEMFVKRYFGLLAQKMAMFSYQPQKLIDAVYAGTIAMMKNDGRKSNEVVFWDKMSEVYGESVRQDEKRFEEFYREEFDNVKISTSFSRLASIVVGMAKDMGLRVVLATNPIFPQIATQKRMAWAGLDHKDFEFYTTYENYYHCKPNLEYYKDILSKLGVDAKECLLVGNDVNEDMIAQELGMSVFLLTNCLINKDNKDISNYPQGDFEDLMEYIKRLG